MGSKVTWTASFASVLAGTAAPSGTAGCASAPSSLSTTLSFATPTIVGPASVQQVYRDSFAWLAIAWYLTRSSAQYRADVADSGTVYFADPSRRSIFDAYGHTNPADWLVNGGLALRATGEAETVPAVAGFLDGPIGARFLPTAVRLGVSGELFQSVDGAFGFSNPGEALLRPERVDAFLMGMSLARTAALILWNRFDHLPPGSTRDFFQELYWRTTDQGGPVFITFSQAMASAGFNPSVSGAGRSVVLGTSALQIAQQIGWAALKDPTLSPFLPTGQAPPACTGVGLRTAVIQAAQFAGLLLHEIGHGVFREVFGLGSGVSNQWEGPDFRTYFPPALGPLTAVDFARDPFSTLLPRPARHWMLSWIAAAASGVLVAGPQTPSGWSADSLTMDQSIAVELQRLHNRICTTPVPANPNAPPGSAGYAAAQRRRQACEYAPTLVGPCGAQLGC